MITDRELIEAIDTSMFLLPELAANPAGSRWVQRVRIPGLRGTLTDGSDPFVNIVGSARLTEENANQTIQQVFDLFAGQNKEFGWIIGPLTTPADLGERLERFGMEKVVEMAGMAYTRPAPPRLGNKVHSFEMERGDTPAVVNVREVTLDELEIAARVLSEGIGFTLEGARATVEALALSPESLRRRHYLAVLEGALAGYASMIYLPGQPIVLLDCAATLEQYRGRGVYTSMVRQRLEDAWRNSAQAAVVQAVRTTSAPVLRKMGFVELANLEWYVST